MDWIKWNKDAVRQVRAASRYRITRDEVVEYYKQEYPGSKTNKAGTTTYTWQSQLAPDLARIAGVKPKSIMRRFQAGRKGHPEEELSAKHQGEFAALGATLPMAPPPGGYHVVYVGGLMFSECEPVDFTIDIQGKAAEIVAREPERVVEIAIKIYMQYALNEKEYPQPCNQSDNGDPEISITANADDHRAPAVKQHKSSVPFLKR